MNSMQARQTSVTTIAPVSSSDGDAHAAQAREHVADLRPVDPTFARDVRRGPVETHALRRLVAEGLGVAPQREEHARLRDRGSRASGSISSAESRRRASFLTSRSAISRVVREHLLERRRADDEAPRVFEDQRGRRARLAR